MRQEASMGVFFDNTFGIGDIWLTPLLTIVTFFKSTDDQPDYHSLFFTLAC